MKEWSPYPWSTKRPSRLAREALASLTTHAERNDAADMVLMFSDLEDIADNVEREKHAQGEAIEKLEEQIAELEADLTLQAEEHTIDLDDYRGAAALSEKVVQVIERAFSEIGIVLPADPSDWHHETVMEAFAGRMAELERT